MTDRELLELAAKAVGNGAQWDCPERGMMVLTPDGNDTMTWNPLASDCDAMQLAIDLCFHMRADGGRSQIDRCMSEAALNSERQGAARLAAMRRAIVRAAAEIGRAMP